MQYWIFDRFWQATEVDGGREEKENNDSFLVCVVRDSSVSTAVR
jgi:hypothetical protein